jgi:hypothetical protein
MVFNISCYVHFIVGAGIAGVGRGSNYERHSGKGLGRAGTSGRRVTLTVRGKVKVKLSL